MHQVNGNHHGLGTGNGQGPSPSANGFDKKKAVVIGGAVLLGWAMLNGAYRSGLQDGLIQSGKVTGVMPVHGPSPFGFFPFPPFLLIAGIVLVVMGIRRGWFGGTPRGPVAPWRRPGWAPWSPPSPPGPAAPPAGPFGGEDPRQAFEAWHRQAHAADPAATHSTGGHEPGWPMV